LISGRPEGRILNRGPPDKKDSSNHLKLHRLTTILILNFLELETQAPKQETRLKLIIRHLGVESAQGTTVVIIIRNNYEKRVTNQRQE
jgi:hypothetical protein